jgi:hypothetical protein
MIERAGAVQDLLYIRVEVEERLRVEARETPIRFGEISLGSRMFRPAPLPPFSRSFHPPSFKGFPGASADYRELIRSYLHRGKSPPLFEKAEKSGGMIPPHPPSSRPRAQARVAAAAAPHAAAKWRGGVGDCVPHVFEKQLILLHRTKSGKRLSLACSLLCKLFTGKLP